MELGWRVSCLGLYRLLPVSAINFLQHHFVLVPIPRAGCVPARTQLQVSFPTITFNDDRYG